MSLFFRKRDDAGGADSAGGTPEFAMVDFFAEADHIIALGLASEKPDVNWKNWYRVSTSGGGRIPRGSVLVLKNARVVCDGAIHGLECQKYLPLSGILPANDGELALGMKGPLDATSKAVARCSCGAEHMIWADATVGSADEAYVVCATTVQPEGASLSIRPFIEHDGVEFGTT